MPSAPTIKGTIKAVRTAFSAMPRPAKLPAASLSEKARYDMPEIGAAVKVKVVQSVVVKKTVNNYVGVLSFVKKLY